MNELISFNQSRDLCVALMKSGHYAKMGNDGIFAIVETAKSIGVDPLQALNGGMYYVKGKVEMTARMMNSIIRSKKHSIMRDEKSDEKICILHGKRSDNGDVWTESFSIEEAQRAGLLKNDVWKFYPKDMLFARALSRLARQLFPDVIGNCYIEGEISFIQNAEVIQEPIHINLQQDDIINDSQQLEIINLCSKLKDSTFSLKLCKRLEIDDLVLIKSSDFEKVKKALEDKIVKESSDA